MIITHRTLPALLLPALLAAALAATAPRPVAGGPVAPAPPAAPREVTTTSALPRFALFGWLSPPLALTTTARYTELAGAGLNLTMLALDDSGAVADNFTRLNVSRPLGVKNMLLDAQLDSVTADNPKAALYADSVAARYRDDPAFAGYYLGDEPSVSTFPQLGVWFAAMRARDPSHPCWNNLQGRNTFWGRADFEAYVRQYVAATHPAVLCDDEYDFSSVSDASRYTENIVVLSTIAREQGIPFWGIVQMVQHWIFLPVTDGMLRWEVGQWLAFGARGIGYFTYWTPAPDPYYDWQPAIIEWGTGNRTEYYDIVRIINARLAPIGNTLAGATWRATQFAGSVPPEGSAFHPNTLIAAVSGRAILGFFADSTNAPLVFVVNSDSASRQNVTLTLAGGRSAWQLSGDGKAWNALVVSPGGQVTLSLMSGDWRLLRFSGAADPLTADVPDAHVPAGSHLRVGPNPALGAVRFALADLATPARLEVLDLAGRRVWTRVLAAGERGATWLGERDGGGRVSAGIYFARLQLAHGTETRRITWLGTP